MMGTQEGGEGVFDFQESPPRKLKRGYLGNVLQSVASEFPTDPPTGQSPCQLSID